MMKILVFLVVLSILFSFAAAKTTEKPVSSVHLINSLICSDSDEMDTSDTFTIIEPNGGENYDLGEAINMRWTSEGNYTDYVNIYLSSDSGNTWTQLATREPDDGSYILSISERGDHYRVKVKDYSDTSTTGGDTSNDDFSVGREGFKYASNKSRIPYQLSISNSPNPFSTSTKITYTVKDFCSTSIKIFDLTGREVSVIKEGTAKPGTYNYIWNPTGLSPGVYICRFKANDMILIRRMTLCR
ncbi:MAG: T9SS type A sorting domain-containing protein [Candidatus Coatesbacteria bacterium]|nr:T9SS type A sorting domain-containing protein [Candidatus Coatesbacteria bacterium]